MNIGPEPFYHHKLDEINGNAQILEGKCANSRG